MLHPKISHRTRIVFLWALLLVAGTLSLSPARELAYQKAPDFPQPADSWIKGNHYDANQIWFNSSPLTFAKLSGKVVLIDFWEYTCINCIRTFDYLKRWDKDYRSLGLVIVGVHSPEFDFAYDPKNVLTATRRFGLHFPVVVDSDFRIWKAYHNNTWPNKFLLGPDHRILLSHSGEGRYNEIERQIREALQAANPKVQLPPMNLESDTDRFSEACGDTTEEVYAGAARGRVEKAPSSDTEGVPFVQGAWAPEPDDQRAQDAHSTFSLRYHGSEIFGVLNSSEKKPVRVEVDQDGRPLDRAHANKDIRFDPQGRSYLIVEEPRMYYLVRNPDDHPHLIRLRPDSAGLGVYSFTFGNKCLTDFSHL